MTRVIVADNLSIATHFCEVEMRWKRKPPCLRQDIWVDSAGETVRYISNVSQLFGISRESEIIIILNRTERLPVPYGPVILKRFINITWSSALTGRRMKENEIKA